MRKLTFSELPWIARVAIAASYLAMWILFEQYVIEPRHWYRWMPFYRVQGFCVYDAAFLVLLVVSLGALGARRLRPES